MSNTVCTSQLKVIPDDLLNEVLKTGLVVVGGKGTGKSNAVKVITREILRRNIATVKIFDQALNWMFDFGHLEYQLIGELSILDNIDNCIYDMTLIDDPQTINTLIRRSVSVDFHNLARLKLLSGGIVNKWILYIVEEAQNVIGSSALRGRENRFWLKAISTGRNLGLSFIFIGQRLADISSKATERCHAYLIGKMLGDNDLRKLRSITNKNLTWKVKGLEVGEFYYYNGQTELLQFPLFNGYKSSEYTPQPEKKGFLARIFNW